MKQIKKKEKAAPVESDGFNPELEGNVPQGFMDSAPQNSIGALQEITTEMAKGKVIIFLAKPEDSLRLLSATRPGLTYALSSLYTQADMLNQLTDSRDFDFMTEFCNKYLELLVSEGARGRKDLKEVAKTQDVPQQNGGMFGFMRRPGGF